MIDVNVKDSSAKVDYPKLMESESGVVLLMTCDCCGVVLHDGMRGGVQVGYSSTTWCMIGMKDFEGELVLKNK